MGGPARGCSATPVDTARRLGGPRSSELALHRVKRQASAHAQKYGIVLTLGVLSCPAIARRAASGDRRTRGASAPSNQELTVLSIKNLTKTYPGGTRALHGVSLKSIWRNERAPEGVARGKAQVQHRKFDPGIRGQFQAHASRDRSLQQTDRLQSRRQPHCGRRKRVGHTLSPHHRRIRS